MISCNRAIDAFTALAGTPLAAELRSRGVRRIFIAGLATDYCMLNTVRDATPLGLEVIVLADATRAVNVHPDDGAKAESEMRQLGAAFIPVDAIVGAAHGRPATTEAS